MKNYRNIAAFIGTAFLAGSLIGCGADSSSENTAQENVQADATQEVSIEPEAADENENAVEEVQEEAAAEEVSEEEIEIEEDSSDEAEANVTVRVGSLKGPTTMGLVNLMSESESGTSNGVYEFTMATQADEISASLVSGDLDIALVPANLAAVLYQKTEGKIAVLDINTLGVLYCVTGDETITTVEDLSGKTVITTGQGTTPEYSLRYLLDAYGVEDCEIEFKSEATEIAASLAEDAMQIAVLPQPFATVAQAQNDQLHAVFSLSDEWDQVSEGQSRMVTGVTVVRSDFLEQYEDAVLTFMTEQKASAEKANTDIEGTAELVAQYGIIEKAPVAQKALPYCGITYIDGEEMRTALEGYLTVLFEQNPKSVGGALPSDDFYYAK